MHFMSLFIEAVEKGNLVRSRDTRRILAVGFRANGAVYIYDVLDFVDIVGNVGPAMGHLSEAVVLMIGKRRGTIP